VLEIVRKTITNKSPENHAIPCKEKDNSEAEIADELPVLNNCKSTSTRTKPNDLLPSVARKTGSLAIIRGEEVAAILRRRSYVSELVQDESMDRAVAR